MCPSDHAGDRVFELRLTGEISEGELEAALGRVSLMQHETRTVVSGGVADQAVLYRLLRLARSYGLDVREVRVISRAGRLSRLEEST
jgi:hypothetical protein